MLAIRMQRTGRKGHAMFRVVVQDARRTPTSGKIVARLGSYDPHAKTVTLDKEKAGFYLEHGAQPSDRVALLLKKVGVKLPVWVEQADKKKGSVRNPDKRRSTRPDEPASVDEAPAEEAPEKTKDTSANEKTETTSAGTQAPEAAEAEKPVETPEAEVSDAEPKETKASNDKPAEEPPQDADKITSDEKPANKKT
jgi:small subunit ribosomal protein S16